MRKPRSSQLKIYENTFFIFSCPSYHSKYASILGFIQTQLRILFPFTLGGLQCRSILRIYWRNDEEYSLGMVVGICSGDFQSDYPCQA